MNRSFPILLALALAACDTAPTAPELRPVDVETGRVTELGLLSIPLTDATGQPWDASSGPDVVAEIRDAQGVRLGQTLGAPDVGESAVVTFFSPAPRIADLDQPLTLALLDDEDGAPATPMGAATFSLVDVLTRGEALPSASRYDLAVPVGGDTARVRVLVEWEL